MIEAIIFDCFGVLAKDSWLTYKQKYFGENTDLSAQAAALNKQVDAGRLAYPEFIHSVALLAGLSDTIAQEQIEDNPANGELFEYIVQLKRSYKIGLLSNAGENWLNDMFTQDQVALFDAVVLSYELGTTKPDALMYTTIAERLNQKPEACLFIDDQPANAAGAEVVGMQAIVYKDFATLRLELEKLLAANT